MLQHVGPGWHEHAGRRGERGELDLEREGHCRRAGCEQAARVEVETEHVKDGKGTQGGADNPKTMPRAWARLVALTHVDVSCCRI